VQREIGYQAIEFGVRARRPAAARETLRRRYGDCKDHALLLHQVLRAAGIESHLALVNTGWRIQPEIPSLDQFNHMVVHVPLLAPGWLVDPTEKHLKLDAFPADSLWHARALLLDPANPRLLPPPPAPLPASARVESRRTVRPSGRDWNVEETLEIDGYYAAWMRSSFAGMSPAEQSQRAQELMGAHGAARVEAFEFRGLDDPMEPARLQIAYTVRDAISSTGASATAALPNCWERFYLTLRFVKERRTAFEIHYPFRFTSQVVVKLPAPASEAGVSGLSGGAGGEFCAWKLRASPAEPGSPDLRVDFEFEARPCEQPAARFGAFHDAWDAARRAWDRTLSWEER